MASKFILYIIALIFPPLAVYMAKGTGRDLWINLFLCCCIWFPGMLHGLYIVSKTEE